MAGTTAGISLRTKLIIAFASMAVIPLFLLYFMTFRTTEQALLNTVVERNKSLASNIAEDIDQMFEEKIRMLKIAVASTDIQSMDAARVVPALSPLTAQHHELLMAIVLTPDGDLLARSDGKQVKANYRDREYFHTAATTGKTTISGVLRSKTTGKLDIGIAEPIKNSDQTLRGLLVIGVSLHKIIDRIAITKIGTSGYAYIVNKNGKILMHPDQSLVDNSADFSSLAPVKAAISGQSGSVEYEYNGLKTLASYNYLPITGWGLVVQQPLGDAMATVNTLRNRNIVIMIVTMLAAVIIVFILAGVIFKPISLLTVAVGRVADGDFTARTSFKSSDEIGALAAAFNNMTAQLHHEETARHKAEEVSRETNELFSLFMRHSPVYVYIKEVTPTGSRVLQASDNFEEMVGISGSDMIGKMMVELFPVEFAAKTDADDRTVVAKGDVLKIDEYLNGRHYTTIKFPLMQGDRTLLAGYTIDITERKQAEEALLALKDTLQKRNEELLLNDKSLHDQNDELLATEEMLRVQIEEYERTQKLLKESEGRFQALLEASFGGVIIHEQGLILDCNLGLSDMTGFTNDELIGMDGLTLIAPESLDTVLANIKSGYNRRYEVVGLRKDGSRYPLAIRGKNSVYKGRDVRVIEFRDITEQKKAEQELRLALAEAQRFRDAIDSFPSCVYMKDHQLRYVYANRLTLEYFGCTCDELAGNIDEHFFPKETVQLLREVDIRVLGGEHTAEEIVIPDPNGGQRVFWEVKSPLYSDAGQQEIWGLWGISTDITERKRTEDELLKIEKLESLGVLAGGIAHDFNNILTGIMGNVSYAQLHLEPGHKSLRPLIEAENASIRASELAHQLLTFARGGEPVKKVFSINQLLSDAISFVLHGSNIKANADIPESLHAIDADAGQINQVLHNIIINADQAMPDGGTLLVSARNCHLGTDNMLSLPPGHYITLTFTDQGCGIPDAVMKRIFDPYYTTKATGNGLGLASVLSIINKHGGKIEVASVVGKGTTFTIHLPSIGETLGAYQSHSAAPTTETHTGGSILVMDDEQIIRDISTDMLQFFGYEVTTCENGSEAVALYQSSLEAGTRYSAVIMDLTVPGGLGGKETAQHILALDPKACLIVSSGYSNDPIMSDYKAFGFAGAVAKPYNIRNVGGFIASLLAEHKVQQ